MNESDQIRISQISNKLIIQPQRPNLLKLAATLRHYNIANF